MTRSSGKSRDDFKSEFRLILSKLTLSFGVENKVKPEDFIAFWQLVDACREQFGPEEFSKVLEEAAGPQSVETLKHLFDLRQSFDNRKGWAI